MSKRILVTSCKGGVGKSTVAANLAHALTLLGRRVLIVDMDLGNRSLDLVFGCEDRVVYDIADVCSGAVGVSDATIVVPEREGLYFIPAPFMYEGDITEHTLRAALDAAEEEIKPDYMILDTSGGTDISVELSAKMSDEALIVTSRNPSSIRAAGKSAALLELLGVGEQRLIINCLELDCRGMRDRTGVLEMIDATGLSLLGIIPKDIKTEILQEKGKLCTEGKHTIAKQAFKNTARRLEGEHVKLLSGVRTIRERQRRRILTGE